MHEFDCTLYSRYYPDFYAPLASDLTDLEGYSVELEPGRAFPPLAQLLAVLPPQSAELLPPSFRELMLDPTSPIFDAYPIDFVLDMNGKRNEWEGVALLPFVDETRLIAAVEANAPRLSPAEAERNVPKREETYRPEDYVPSVDDLPLPADGAFDALKVVELRQLLSVRGCNTRGRKAELVSRLQQAVEDEQKV
jgi:5'-3' exonuclease